MTAGLADKVILVTGAAGGIGAMTARKLGQLGAQVIVNDLTVAGAEVAAQIEQAGGKALFIQADAANADDVQCLVDTIVEEFGRLDAAVNNAGVDHAHLPLHEISEEIFDRTIAINLKGVWLCMRSEIAQMLKQGDGGAIVNTASVAGLVGAGMFGAYAASKHGVLGLTKTAAIEYAKHGIRVNAVCPSFTNTAMFERGLELQPKLLGWVQRSNPAGRLGEPEEIADAIIWLLSGSASFVHGHALAIDGGMTIR